MVKKFNCGCLRSKPAQRDPSGESGGLNLYLVNDGDPINRIDSTGESASDVWSAGWAGIKAVGHFTVKAGEGV